MVGSAVATMVWSSAPKNIASMMPTTMVRISGWESAGACGGSLAWLLAPDMVPALALALALVLELMARAR